jgi:hypothetical protein
MTIPPNTCSGCPLSVHWAREEKKVRQNTMSSKDFISGDINTPKDTNQFTNEDSLDNLLLQCVDDVPDNSFGRVIIFGTEHDGLMFRTILKGLIILISIEDVHYFRIALWQYPEFHHEFFDVRAQMFDDFYIGLVKPQQGVPIHFDFL